MTPLTWIRTRLTGRADSEHEQATLRVLIAIGTIVYLQQGESRYPAEWLYASRAYLMVLTACVAAAFVILA